MRKFIMFLIIIIFVLFLYGKYIEVNSLNFHGYTLYNENIPDSFKDLKIIQFSDILYSKNSNTKLLDKLVNKINKEKADIIIFNGDLFKNGEKYSESDFNTLKDYFSKMNANLYKYAVIGDNDQKYLDNYKEILDASSFKLLDDENTLFFYKDITPINIIGLTNIDKLSDLLITELEYSYTLVITHKPDNVDIISTQNVNAVLSGHSLGGIINVPYYGGLIKKDGAKKYVNDYYKVNNTDLYISNGIGYDKFNYRLFNTPSINIFRFSN